MNEKEVAEIRRRFKPEKSSITHVRGCYVNESGEIVSQFDQSLGIMSQEDGEMILSTLKRTLSGGLGRNLVDISFSTQQVVGSDEHSLLMALRDSSLADENAVQAFFQRAIASLDLEGSYLILLARDAYDVPYRSGDGDKQADGGSEVYSYILCSVCPVKMTKPALSYRAHENLFGHLAIDWVVAPPELGFLFPAFNDRSADIYSALYYSRDAAENHQGFVDTVFHVEPPMPAEQQKQTFQAVLRDSLADECSFDVVQAVQDQLCGMIEMHKESKVPEPLVISKGTVKQVLSSCGVTQEHTAAFEEKYVSEFGEDTGLSPKNLVDTKQLEICTPDVTIRVSPERSDLVETRVIDGVKYILIRADESVEVNGVNVHIS